MKYTYSHSSGPGGQHVNTTNSKVQLKLTLDGVEKWLPSETVENLKNRYAHMITKQNELILQSELTRKQFLNKAVCLKKLREILHEASKPIEAPKSSFDMLDETKKELYRIRSEQKRRELKLRKSLKIAAKSFFIYDD